MENTCLEYENILCDGILVFGAQIACQQTFLALGQAKISNGASHLLRKIVLLVPLIFILPLFLQDGLQAVLLAEPIADIVATAVTVSTFIIFYKKKLGGSSQKMNNESIA